MFESMMYDFIINRMLDRVSVEVDKREGSIIFDALAPAAKELEQVYIDLDILLNQTYADTASRENLSLRAKERGLAPLEASHAVVKGEFDIDVPIGSRFNLGDLNYTVKEKLGNHIFTLQCETAGTIGNRYTGNIIPMEYIEGLKRAKIVDVMIPGEDEEDTEVFRKRYFDSFDTQGYGGNVKDYKTRVNAIQGVGGVKVEPTWNGGGTVKITFITSEYKIPTSDIVDYVQEIVCPLGEQTGLGIAPIGHIVTVAGAESETINLLTSISLEDGWVWKDVQDNINNAIDVYFLDLAKSWETETSLIVRISQIENRILDVSGVLDIGNTSINGAESNIVLDANKIPLRGTINV